MRHALLLLIALSGCAGDAGLIEICAEGDTYTGEGQQTEDSCVCGDEEGESTSSWNELPEGCVATCDGEEWVLADEGCEDVQRE